MNCCLNTDTLMYLTLDPAKLSSEASRALDRADLLFVSAISFWEISVLVKRRKIKLPMPLPDFIRLVKDISNLEIVPVHEKIVIGASSLNWSHSDPADRFVVATAEVTGSRLITSDPPIREFYSGCIW